MIEVNLIPDVKREYLKTRSIRNLVISMSVMVGIGVVGLVAVLGLVFGGQLVAESIQDNSIKEEGQKLTAIPDLNKTVTIQQQLNVIDSLHSKKSINSRLFDVMTAINPPAPNNIRFSVVKLNPEDKSIRIEGSAENSYAALAVFKKTITNTIVQSGDSSDEVKSPLAENIISGDTSFGENSEGRRVLRFELTFNYPSELFEPSKGRVSVIAPTGRIDVTDSKLGVPGSLFGARAKDLPSDSGGED